MQNSEHLLENLKLLLSGDDDYDNEDYHGVHKNGRPFENAPDLDDNTLLRSYLKELSSRQNLDFTDQLWRLIIGASDYAQMTDCLHTVFKEIVENDYKPQVKNSRSKNEALGIAKKKTNETLHVIVSHGVQF